MVATVVVAVALVAIGSDATGVLSGAVAHI